MCRCESCVCDEGGEARSAGDCGTVIGVEEGVKLWSSV